MDKSNPVTERALAAIERADALLRKPRDHAAAESAAEWERLYAQAQIDKAPTPERLRAERAEREAAAEREARNARRKPRNLSRPNIRYREIEEDAIVRR
jgi:hypothetical protein